MPRKVAKTGGSKRQVKQRVKAAVFSLAHKMEKEFKNTPNKIAAAYRKDLSTFKQHENKLKTEIRKLEQSEKAAKKKIAEWSKSKNATAKNKQLNTAKQTQRKLAAINAEMLGQMEMVRKNVQLATSRQAKWLSFGKEFSAWEKKWDAQSTRAVKPRNKPVRKQNPIELPIKETVPPAKEPVPATPVAPETTEFTS